MIPLKDKIKYVEEYDKMLKSARKSFWFRFSELIAILFSVSISILAGFYSNSSEFDRKEILKIIGKDSFQFWALGLLAFLIFVIFILPKIYRLFVYKISSEELKLRDEITGSFLKAIDNTILNPNKDTSTSNG